MGRNLPLFIYSQLLGRSEKRWRSTLLARLQNGALDQNTFDQLFAVEQSARPAGELIWMHIATVGSIRPAAELMSRLLEDRPDAAPLVTFSSGISPKKVPQTLGEVRQLPLDAGFAIKRFLNHWQPNILIWFGGSFRPRLLQETRTHGIPCLSIDADDGHIGLESHSFIPNLTAQTADAFDHIVAETDLSAQRWNRLGIEFARIEVCGRLGEGGAPVELDEDRAESLSQQLGTRPCWYASHLQSSELSDVFKAHRVVLRRSHRALLAVSMADATDCAQARNLASDFGLQVRWSVDETTLEEGDQVLIVPQAENTLWHRLAPISFLGSSLSASGGIDPFAASAMGSAIVHGTHVSNFSAAYDRLCVAKASNIVRNGKELCSAIETLLSPDRAAALAQAAWDVATAGAEATDRVNDLTQDILDLQERAMT